MFTRTQGNGKVTGDGSQFYLKGTGPYEMWDGLGNRYFFDKQVAGFDDLETDGYTHDFGRGRDGWYLGSLTDPHGNGYTVTYWDGVASPVDLRRLDVQPCDHRVDADAPSRGHRRLGAEGCHAPFGPDRAHPARFQRRTSTGW